MTPLVLTPTGLRFAGKRFPCTIGKGGISLKKQEGDGATPVGALKIVGMLYRPDRLHPPQPWARAIGNTDLWSDASGEPDYNHLVTSPYAHSHEKLRRADPLYDLVFITDWNWPNAKPGRGSAIFLHQFRRPGYPTEGCIALRRDHLHWIAKRVQLGTPVVIPNAHGTLP
ncbi:L,D-transpeptidase family protein [Cognatishimia sp. WU-CL00825]|uniref:L,D-transpeptidase family protein n=1 Tax=Cognatishimia sp. WU-CL00825 TaxID=3127658 RepID=UPI003108B055